jgi:hypothetical protein
MSSSDQNRNSVVAKKEPRELKADWEARIESHFARTGALDRDASLRFKVHPELGSLEYMVGGDLAAGLPSPLSGPLHQRSIQFVRYWSNLTSSEELSVANLSLKMPLTSTMGSHFILESRTRDAEEPTTSFALHFDRDEHLVFFTAIYQPFFARDDGGWGEDRQTKIKDTTADTVADLRSGNLPSSLSRRFNKAKLRDAVVQTELHWLPDFEQERMRPCVQVKFGVAKQDWVLYYDQNGQFIRGEEACSKAGFTVAPLIDRFWDKSSQPGPARQPLRRVILPDLALKRSLTPLEGRYVRVHDHVNQANPIEWNILQEWLHTPDRMPKVEDLLNDLRSTQVDRILAYYHIDQIQRYFRELGLSVLDEYEELNPLEVDLGSNDMLSTSRYLHDSKALVFPQVNREAKFCTQARSPHILYHEYVHAVTDAIARLGRGRAIGKKDKHLRQILQAKALDEGLADYFACSLAERNGAQYAQVGELKVVGGELVLQDSARDLESSSTVTQKEISNQFNHLLNKGEQAFQAGAEADIEARIYELGTLWSHFLWRFRKKVDRDVADTIIANSIFFLTRWASFGLALQALSMAARLLFGDAFAKVISEDPAFLAFKDWDLPRLKTTESVAGAALYEESSRPGQPLTTLVTTQ